MRAMRLIRAHAVLFSLLLAGALSGCSDFRVVKSDFIFPVPAKSNEAPLSLVVGIKVDGQTLSGGFADMGPTFASRLTASGLFKSIFYPVRSDDKLDLLMEANFSGNFVADGGSFAKGFFTGFFMFLPAPFVEYEHHYKTSAVVRVSQGGKQLKSYSAGSDTAIEMKVFAPHTEVERQGVAAATNSLMDRIIAQISNDRAFFGGLRSGSE